MQTVRNPNLDPRLRRLVGSTVDDSRIRADVRRGVVRATAATADEALVTAETVSKRVLVRLTSDRIPEGFAEFNWVRIVEGIYAVEVPVLELEALGAAAGVKYVEAGRVLGTQLSSSVPETRADRVRTGPPGLDGTGVVVGIIDFGLDYTLDDFRNADGSTRVAFLWDQTLTPQGGETAPARFGHGVEYDRAAIDAALSGINPDPFASVRHKPEAGSHGTHVAGTAAGNGRSGDPAYPAGQFIGVAPGATIIFVHPNTADLTTTFTDSVHVAEAVAYIFEKAGELGMPCVINMSLGQNGGSHDGESLVERAIDRLLEQPGRAMTIAAGNEHIFRGHASGRLALGQTRALRWKFGGEMPIPGGGATGSGVDITPNEMEIWYSSRDLFRVRVLDPDGNATSFVAPGETESQSFPSGDEIFIDSERFSVLNGDARIYLEVSRNAGSLKRGEWQIELEAVEVADGRFDAWIERDARRRSNNFADQSFFVGTDFDGVRTLGTPSTGRRSLAVANYDHATESPSDSSGRGATRDGREKPEVAAPGTNIFSSGALGGRLVPSGGGQRFPMRVRMSGTSMASPHVAGIVALLFERDARLTADQARKILIAAARPPAGVVPFDAAWGFGKVDAERAVALLG